MMNDGNINLLSQRTKKLLFTFFMILAAYGLQAYDNHIDIHGFSSQGFVKSRRYDFQLESQSGTFQFNETGINFGVDLQENLRLGVQFLSRDFGRSGNNDFILDWGFADYKKSDRFGVRIGKVRIPMGIYNQIRDFDMLRTSVFLPQVMYDEQLRSYMTAAQGFSLYGMIPLHESGDLEYEYVLGNANGQPDSKLFFDAATNLQNQLNAFSIAMGGPGGILVTDPKLKSKRLACGQLR